MVAQACGVFAQLISIASFNEKLLLGNGLCVSPLKGQNIDEGQRSLRDVLNQIDNAKDLHNHLLSFSGKTGIKPIDFKYERNPVSLLNFRGPYRFSLISRQTFAPAQQTPNSNNRLPQPTSFSQSPNRFDGRPDDLISSGSNYQPSNRNDGEIPIAPSNNENEKQLGDSARISEPSRTFAAGQVQTHSNQEVSPAYSPSSIPASAFNNDNNSTDIPPRPIFGLSLEDLLKRDGSAIPSVVYQCIQAIDLFGLEVEGIYRLSGSAVHITKLRTIFDNGKEALI